MITVPESDAASGLEIGTEVVDRAELRRWRTFPLRKTKTGPDRPGKGTPMNKIEQKPLTEEESRCSLDELVRAGARGG